MGAVVWSLDSMRESRRLLSSILPLPTPSSTRRSLPRSLFYDLKLLYPHSHVLATDSSSSRSRDLSPSFPSYVGHLHSPTVPFSSSSLVLLAKALYHREDPLIHVSHTTTSKVINSKLQPTSQCEFVAVTSFSLPSLLPRHLWLQPTHILTTLSGSKGE